MRGTPKNQNLWIIAPLLIIGLIVSVGFYESRRSYNLIIDSARHRNAALAHLVAQRLIGAFREIDYIMRDVHDHIDQEALAFSGGAGGESAAHLSEIMLNKITTHPWLFGLGIINTRGRVVGIVSKARQDIVDPNFSYQHYFSHLASHPDQDRHCSTRFVEPSNGDLWLFCARPVRLQDSSAFHGVIFAELHLSYLDQLFHNPDLAPRNAIALIDAEGTLLFHYPEAADTIGKKIEVIPLDEEHADREQPFQGALISPLDGQRRPTAYYPLADLPYTMAVTAMLEDELWQWRFQRTIYLGVGILISGFMIGLALLAARLSNARGQLVVQAMQLEHRVLYDKLTSLPNRDMLDERLDQAISASKRAGLYGALMLIELEHLKPLNDAYGHAVGDRLLVEAGQRLLHSVSEVDTVARLGGAEFVVVLVGLKDDKDVSKEHALAIAKKIRGFLSEPYHLILHSAADPTAIIEHYCSSSMGIALFIGKEAHQSEIFKQADTARRQAKEAGRNMIRLFESGL